MGRTKGRVAALGFAAQLRAVAVGDSLTVTKAVTELPVAPNAMSKYSLLISGYAHRARPGCSWTYETFSCVTSRGRVLVGCVITLQAEPTQ